ncbi:hypothetical protein Tco_0547660 [Tanacetum coccineum]
MFVIPGPDRRASYSTSLLEALKRKRNGYVYCCLPGLVQVGASARLFIALGECDNLSYEEVDDDEHSSSLRLLRGGDDGEEFSNGCPDIERYDGNDGKGRSSTSCMAGYAVTVASSYAVIDVLDGYIGPSPICGFIWMDLEERHVSCAHWRRKEDYDSTPFILRIVQTECGDDVADFKQWRKDFQK